MKRPRKGRSTKRTGYHSQLLRAIGDPLPQRGLALIGRDRRRRWTDRLVTVAAILMSWSVAPVQQDAFAEAREATVAMYGSRRRPGRTLTGFLGALVTHSVRLLVLVVGALRRASVRVAGPYWRWGPWAVLGVDGSRVECPRTAANEAAFGRGGRKKTGPQQWLTTVFHVATGLIWDWRRGRADAAERTHLREMLGGLPQRTLLLADAGFTGYELLEAVLRAGQQFIVRVGRNVHLLRELGVAWERRKGLVHLWPTAHRDQPPLVLRLVVVQDGKRPMYLVTSVLAKKDLSDRDVAKLYALRWGIEVMYRSLKQTMGKRKMRSTAPAAARVELDWAMVGLWMLGLLAVRQVRRTGRAPSWWSVAGALRAVRVAMRRAKEPTRDGGLDGQLRRAIKDDYQRRGPKTARNWPRKKTERPAGTPHIRTATRAEVCLAQAVRFKEAAG